MNSKRKNIRSVFRKDANSSKLPEVKILLEKDFYIDSMKFSTNDFIAVEYEENMEKDDLMDAIERREEIFSKPSNDDIISLDIESCEREKNKNEKLKNNFKLKGTAKSKTGKLEKQSKGLRRRTVSASFDKVLKEELTTNVRNVLKYPNKRRRKSFSSSADSAKNELLKTEDIEDSSRNSSPAGKSSGRQKGAEEEGIEEKSTEVGLEAEEEDDPNKLWCVCRQPHKNKFMIMCDYCEDWFHGNCVGISKQKGREMEKREQEWICPNCEKKGRGLYMKFIRNSL